MMHTSCEYHYCSRHALLYSAEASCTVPPPTMAGVSVTIAAASLLVILSGLHIAVAQDNGRNSEGSDGV